MNFEDMKQAMKQGVQVVSAPQLFPTPPELARQIVLQARVDKAGLSVLEPSAGLGALLHALDEYSPSLNVFSVYAVELNQSLARSLQATFPSIHVFCADFPEWASDRHKRKAPPFDRIIANPPFVRGSDIAHIKAMLPLLAKGGRLVSLCANGPRQQKELKPLGEWHPLPTGAFTEAGTNVNVAMLVVQR
jgi:phospholipid N-methyltransferase